MKKANAQKLRPNKSQVVTEFLKGLLAQGPVGVPEIEDMARAAGHLGKRQSITHLKPFQAAKKALKIRSIRAGFATEGRWCWHLPRDGGPNFEGLPVWRIFPHPIIGDFGTKQMDLDTSSLLHPGGSNAG